MLFTACGNLLTERSSTAIFSTRGTYSTHQAGLEGDWKGTDSAQTAVERCGDDVAVWVLGSADQPQLQFLARCSNLAST